MKVCKEYIPIKNDNSIMLFEQNNNIKIPEELVSFFTENNGGTPIKNYFKIDEEEFEIRFFLSFNENDNYGIFKPAKYLLNETKSKLVPFAVDSGDNYYCYNLENGKIYRTLSDEEGYLFICEKLDELLECLI